jgi:hypothetical protein
METQETQPPAESAPVVLPSEHRRGPKNAESTRKFLPRRHLIKSATQQWKVFVGREPTAVERNALNYFTIRARSVVE